MRVTVEVFWPDGRRDKCRLLFLGMVMLFLVGLVPVSAQTRRTILRSDFRGDAGIAPANQVENESQQGRTVFAISAMDEEYPRSGSVLSSSPNRDDPVMVAIATDNNTLPEPPSDEILSSVPARLGYVSSENPAVDNAVLDTRSGESGESNETVSNDSGTAVYFDTADAGGYGYETLEDLWNVALENSRKLQSKDFEYAQAQENIRAARGLGLPKVANASGWHAVSEQYAIEGSIDVSSLVGVPMSMPYESPILDKNFATSVTTLTIPVYMGGRVRGMIEAADNASAAISSGREISRLDLKYEVATTYLLVLRVRSLLQVAEETERTLDVHRKDAQRLFETGVVTKNVLLMAETALANAQHDVLKARNAVTLSEAALNRLLWRPLDKQVAVADCLIPDRSGDLESLTSAAEHCRPELAALAHKSRALAAQAKVKRADRLPHVALVGAHNYVENSHMSTNQSLSGSIGMVWMPLDGGVSRARQQAAEYESMSVIKEYEDARTAIELQVYQALLDEDQSRNRIDVAQKAVEQATENLRVANNSFREGIASHTEVLDATTLWAQTQSNLTNARYDAIQATFAVRRAVGNL